MGDPAQDVLYGPMLDQKFATRFEEYLGWIQPHHKVLGSSGLGRINSANPRDGFIGDPEAGLFYHPTIVNGVQPGDALFLQETFGPIVGVTTYATLDEAITLANTPGYGLSSAVYTNDPHDAFRFRQGIGAGMVVSITPRRGLRRTCHSAGTGCRGTAAGRPVSGCSTSSPAGRR